MCTILSTSVRLFNEITTWSAAITWHEWAFMIGSPGPTPRSLCITMCHDCIIWLPFGHVSWLVIWSLTTYYHIRGVQSWSDRESGCLLRPYTTCTTKIAKYDWPRIRERIIDMNGKLDRSFPTTHHSRLMIWESGTMSPHETYIHETRC